MLQDLEWEWNIFENQNYPLCGLLDQSLECISTYFKNEPGHIKNIKPKVIRLSLCYLLYIISKNV